MLQYTLTGNSNIGITEQTRMAINAGCSWIEIDPTLVPDSTLDEIIDLCRTGEIILVFRHHDDLLEKTRVHGIHLGKGDADPLALRERLGGHPIIGVDVTTESALATLKRADVDYVTLEGFPETSTLSTISELQQKEVEQNTLIPIVVSGRIATGDIQSIIDAGASGINIDITSLQGPEYEASLATFISACNSVER